MGMIRRVRAAILAAIVLSSATVEVAAAERYYVLIFGSQSQPKRLRYTHTWATFVRAVGEGPDPSGHALYIHTISWLPQTLEVRVWSPFPEPGVNLDLYQTLDAVAAHGERGHAVGAVRDHAGHLRAIAPGLPTSSTAASSSTGRSAPRPTC